MFPLAAPYLGLTNTDGLNTLKHDLKMMEALGKGVDVLDGLATHDYRPDHFHDPDHPNEPIAYKADAAALRQLQELLIELDPDRNWGNMIPKFTPEGEVLWLCDAHRELY